MSPVSWPPRIAALLGVLALAACAEPAAAPGPRLPPPQPTAAPRMLVYAAPALGASHYTTTATAGAVRGDAEAQALASAVVAARREQGEVLEGDGRLGALAEWVAANLDSQGKVPPAQALELAAHRLGLPEPVPEVAVVHGEADRETWERTMRQALASAPAVVAYNRVGVAMGPSAGKRALVVVLGASHLELAPVPRRLQTGGSIALRGRLLHGYVRPRFAATKPGGAVEQRGPEQGEAFDVVLAAASAGTHRIEVLGEGPRGIQVLANFPVHVGVEEPRTIALPAPAAPGTEGGDALPERAAAQLHQLLNETRRAAGLAPLAPHPALALVALTHSRDMADHGFFGHVSPTTGDVGARVRTAGLAFPIVAENVGLGPTSADVHRSLLDSPGHRANALSPKLTHVGIGVVIRPRAGQRDLFVTEVFARVPVAIDLGRAPAEVLERINAARAARGAKPLVSEPALGQVATEGAALYFGEDKPTGERLLDRVVESLGWRLKQPRSGGLVHVRRAEAYFLSAPALEDVSATGAALDPTARFAGIGVVQGTRRDTGPGTIAVVIIVAWDR